MNDEDLYEEYKQKDAVGKIIYTGKFYQYGKMIGLKWC